MCKLFVLDKNGQYHITVCEKEKTTTQENVNINIQWMGFSNLLI